MTPSPGRSSFHSDRPPSPARGEGKRASGKPCAPRASRSHGKANGLMFDIFGVPSQALLSQLVLGLINGSFYALLSLGLAVIFGMLNIINFAHGAQYMLGAFMAFFLLQY